MVLSALCFPLSLPCVKYAKVRTPSSQLRRCPALSQEHYLPSENIFKKLLFIPSLGALLQSFSLFLENARLHLASSDFSFWLPCSPNLCQPWVTWGYFPAAGCLPRPFVIGLRHALARGPGKTCVPGERLGEGGGEREGERETEGQRERGEIGVGGRERWVRTKEKASVSREPRRKAGGLSQNGSPSGTRQTPRVGELRMMSLRLFSILLAAVVSGARGWGYCECWSQRQVGFGAGIWSSQGESCTALRLGGRRCFPYAPARSHLFLPLPSAPQCSSGVAARAPPSGAGL